MTDMIAKYSWILILVLPVACQNVDFAMTDGVAENDIPTSINEQADNMNPASKTYEAINFSVKELPAKSRTLQFCDLNDPKYEEELKAQELLRVYVVRITSNENIPLLEYDNPEYPSIESKYNYFMTEFASQVKFIAGQDTLNPVMSHLEKPNTLVPYLDVLLSFDASQIKYGGTLIIEDEYFKAGRIKLKI